MKINLSRWCIWRTKRNLKDETDKSKESAKPRTSKKVTIKNWLLKTQADILKKDKKFTARSMIIYISKYLILKKCVKDYQ